MVNKKGKDVARSLRDYTNPVSYDDGTSYTAPDPFVLRYRGLYYCYATNVCGVTVSVSSDLVHWHRHGYAYQEAGRKNYWAPSVILINGLFHMYVSNMPDDSFDTHDQVMRVAVSYNPMGPFEIHNSLFQTFAIDSQVYRCHDGQLYLFYADNQFTGLSEYRAGTSVIVDRLLTPFELEGNPRLLIIPTSNQEIFERNRFGDGHDWHTVEAATFFTYRNQAFITYSGNSYEHEDYFVDYATAHLETPFLSCNEDRSNGISSLKWLKHMAAGRVDPLLVRNEGVEGPGHNCIVKAPNGIDDWIVYHGRNAGSLIDSSGEQRVMRIDPLFYADKGLDCPGPSWKPKPLPSYPDILDDFEKESFSLKNSSLWDVLSGDASCHDRTLTTPTDADFEAIVDSQEYVAYSLRVCMKIAINPLGSRSGIIARYSDESNKTLVSINAGIGVICVTDIERGVATRYFCNSDYLKKIDFSTWHEITVSRTFSRCEIQIDDIPVMDVSICASPGRVGLLSIRSRSDFSAFIVTGHMNLWGASMAALRNVIVSAKRIEYHDEEFSPIGGNPAEIIFPEMQTQYRLVLDTAINWNTGSVGVTIGDLRVTATAESVSVELGGHPIEGFAEPERSSEFKVGVFEDEYGRVIRTIRIVFDGDSFIIHVRGTSWHIIRPAFLDMRVVCTLQDSALVGYASTSLGRRFVVSDK